MFIKGTPEDVTKPKVDVTKPKVDVTRSDSYITNQPEPEPEPEQSYWRDHNGEPSNAFRGVHVSDHLKDED